MDFDDDEPLLPFHEFKVIVTTLSLELQEPVVLSVWAASIEDAMDCGEVLSSIYLR